MLPNFLVCGIQRGGTTSLYHYLRAHPDVFMPKVKEINFFNVHYQKGRAWYESHFASSRGKKAVGEASPLYMYHPEVPHRIADLIPTAKLIFLLRNPIDRAYSNYWFNVGRGAQNPSQSFSEVIRTKDGYYRYITKGFYYEQIRRFLQYFDRAQLNIILSEDLASKPSYEIGLCFQFLGVNMNYLNDTYQFHNMSLIPYGPVSGKLFALWIPIKDLLRSLTPKAIRNMTRGFRLLIHGLFFVPQKPPPMKEGDCFYLQGVFHEQNQLLADFLKQDLARWK